MTASRVYLAAGASGRPSGAATDHSASGPSALPSAGRVFGVLSVLAQELVGGLVAAQFDCQSRLNRAEAGTPALWEAVVAAAAASGDDEVDGDGRTDAVAPADCDDSAV